jgi:hypothetical protein
MPRENYRYDCLDDTGHLQDAEWFRAGSDRDAIAIIEAKHPDGVCEIWQGRRLVAKFSPKPPSSLTQ